MFLRELFARNKKNVKEQRARAHAAFVVEVFFSEFVLPLEWGAEFQKTIFKACKNKQLEKTLSRQPFWLSRLLKIAPQTLPKRSQNGFRTLPDRSQEAKRSNDQFLIVF